MKRTTTPREPLALRENLPNISQATRELLVRWGAECGDLPWLLQRSAAYYDAQVCRPAGPPACDDLYDATAALDLLQWRTGCKTPTEAVAWLRQHERDAQEGCAEVATLEVQSAIANRQSQIP